MSVLDGGGGVVRGYSQLLGRGCSQLGGGGGGGERVESAGVGERV